MSRIRFPIDPDLFAQRGRNYASYSRKPAGFGSRFLAWIVDNFIVGLLTIPVFVFLLFFYLDYNKYSLGDLTHNEDARLGLSFLFGVVSQLITFVYYSWFYAEKGASPGKMLFGLRVINYYTGENLSYSLTFLREVFGKWLSSFLLFFGYIIAAFRDDGRALHDLLLQTQVIENEE